MPTHSNAGPLADLALRCQPDSRLVALAREGQERAFDEIVHRYRGPLVAFAAAIVPPHRAEDVVQDALANAHGALSRGDSEISLRPWLYTIVRNRALNALRDEPLHEHLDESFDGVPQPPEVVARRAELAALMAQLKGLPALQREALVRRELEGRSHREIAGSLGVTPGAVRALIYRARIALRNGVGALIPLPVLRWLLDGGSLGTGAAGTGIGSATAGLTAGGGGGIALKAGTTLVVAVLAVGSGIALRQHAGGQGASTEAIAGMAGTHRGSTAHLAGAVRARRTASGVRANADPAGSRSSDASAGSSRGQDATRNDGSDGPSGSGDRSGNGSGTATATRTSGHDGESGSGTSGDTGTSDTSGDSGTSGTSGDTSSGDGGSTTTSGDTSSGDGGSTTTSGDGSSGDSSTSGTSDGGSTSGDGGSSGSGDLTTILPDGDGGSGTSGGSLTSGGDSGSGGGGGSD